MLIKVHDARVSKLTRGTRSGKSAVDTRQLSKEVPDGHGIYPRKSAQSAGSVTKLVAVSGQTLRSDWLNRDFWQWSRTGSNGLLTGCRSFDIDNLAGRRDAVLVDVST